MIYDSADEDIQELFESYDFKYWTELKELTKACHVIVNSPDWIKSEKVTISFLLMINAFNKLQQPLFTKVFFEKKNPKTPQF